MDWQAPLVTCATCSHFAPNGLNPLAGLGDCLIDHWGETLGEGRMLPLLPWPNARRQCGKHQPLDISIRAA